MPAPLICKRPGSTCGGWLPSAASPAHPTFLQILEEVGLTGDQVTLVRSGRPLLVDDGRRHFCVHPFLWKTEGEEEPGITLNWENLE